MAECVRHDLKCIAFCKTKKLCELVLRYCREILRDTGAGHLAELVAAYGAGTPRSTGARWRALFGGALRAWRRQMRSSWASTSATSTALSISLPGTVASLVQQSGRAGAARGGPQSTSCSTARSTSTSCGIARPFERPIERAAVDPQNFKINASARSARRTRFRPTRASPSITDRAGRWVWTPGSTSARRSGMCATPSGRTQADAG